MPDSCKFGPLDVHADIDNRIVMGVDEFETIRLIDFEGFTQEEAAEQMSVARSTVQLIYNDARKKLADSLVNGKILTIEGGKFRLCEGNENFCGRGCRRQRRGRRFEGNRSGIE